MKYLKLFIIIFAVLLLYPLSILAVQNEFFYDTITDLSANPDQIENKSELLKLSKSSLLAVGCPPQALFGQNFQSPIDTDWVASTSDNGAIGSILVFDNFINSGSINKISFWGINGYYTDDRWYVCYESPMAFQIKFYTDNNGTLGAVYATYNIPCVGYQTGVIYRGAFELYQYYADLPEAVDLSEGWITIQGIDGNPECWFEWMSSTDGYDGSSLQWDGAKLNSTKIDRAFCLQHQEYLCGDIDGDNTVNLYDIIYYIHYRFKGGPPPASLLTSDVNSDGKYDIIDIVILCSFHFKNGTAPFCQ